MRNAIKIKDNKTVSEIFSEIKSLKQNEIKEVLNFIYFIKIKNKIEPSQAYFWTKKWQKWEKEADEDRKAKKIIGDGTISNLLKELKK